MTQQDQHGGTDAPADAGPAAVPAPRAAVPDLGFFAGAPQPRDTSGIGGFGGPATTSQFGGAATSQFGGAATSHFGGPATSQFGGPAPAFPGPVGPPPGSLAAPRGPIATLRSTSGGRWALRVGIGIGISLVLGIFGIGRFAGLDLFGQDLSVPSRLGGLAPSTDGSARSLLEANLAAAESAYGVDLEVQVYGEGTTSIVFIGATGEGSLSDPEMTSMLNSGTASASAHQVGDNTCATLEGGAGSMCARIEDGLLVAVMTAGRDDVATSAITDEAWAAQ